jgi:rhodanese-related sulfurtransferase
VIVDPRALRGPISALFPRVRWIETPELAEALDRPTSARPVLLDSRTHAEHALSHLDGARRIDPAAHDLAALDLPRTAPLVVYCSVGYRSAVLCRRLAAQGYTDVRNLAGGIFQWANEGRPLQSDAGGDVRVHPFSRFWAAWLSPALRASLATRESSRMQR